MEAQQVTKDLGIADRLRRSPGRSGRVKVASARVTEREHDALDDAAGKQGKGLSEWAREVLLREARAAHTETAVFTELVALRMLVSTVLRSVALGETLSPETYAQIIAEVRAGKHEAARDLISQYQSAAKE
jgi:hypothetical protein